MVAPTKKRPISIHLTQTTVGVGLGAAFLVILFVVGLYWGGKSEGKKSSETSNALHHREEAVRQSVRECNDAEMTILKNGKHLDDAATEIKDRNQKLDERNKELYQEHSEQETAIAKCQEETETQLAIFTEKDEEQKRHLRNIKEEIELLEQSLRDLTDGHGMRTVLLHASIGKMEERYKRVVQAIDHPAYFVRSPEKLLAKHASKLDKMDALLEQNRLLTERTITNWTHWRYNSTADHDIFLNTVDSDEEIIRPSAFGRTGTPAVTELRRPLFRASTVTSSLAERFVKLYDFATCAWKLNNPNFTFPNNYYWHYHIEADRAFLSNVVDTPMMIFCNGCHDRRYSKEFQIACQDELATAVYGGHDFWAARSRIRFYPSVEHEADNFIFANDLKGKKYLAVTLHASADTYQRCEDKVAHSPGSHYLYIRGNFDEEENHPIAQDPILQCSPTWDQMATRIKETLAKDPEIESVYLSIEPESMDRVHYDDLPGVHIVMMEQKSAFDEAVDMVVAARATRILVSPYLEQSQVITEEFLLRHQLTPNGNVEFF
ncbi:membrane-associated protein, putative [Bodo saltans]|uniref:Membrane-associated protein, putative n=1 Tax=Bodo saltans TaxID=75058 RepID=A0A0S4J8J1_BODSA|nr:membrane-associated protein, putative [Bodo saltans]|eukprot:CUG84141.1 membrane-associated protein, putative [Bodo saltans]